MRKRMFTAYLSGLVFTANFALAEPVPIDNAVQPCDRSPDGAKPSCNIDSGGVKTPPNMPNASDGAIIIPDAPSPDSPSKGFPDRNQAPGTDVIDPSKSGKPNR